MVFRCTFYQSVYWMVVILIHENEWIGYDKIRIAENRLRGDRLVGDEKPAMSYYAAKKNLGGYMFLDLVWTGCAAWASKPTHFFENHFARKYPFLGIFLKIQAHVFKIFDANTPFFFFLILDKTDPCIGIFSRKWDPCLRIMWKSDPSEWDILIAGYMWVHPLPSEKNYKIVLSTIEKYSHNRQW